ncbi:MAG: hypothetical protein GZ094_08365 [Mariniphaga sp.]|nr:hypothetical protein [Mariniphaga sp.]
MGSSPLPHMLLPTHRNSQIANSSLRQLIKIKAIFRTTMFLTALLLLPGIYNFGWGQATQSFTTSGSFTVPSGVTSITVECWGGGGAGGGNTTNSSDGGGGGAGGAFASKVVTVIPGNTYTVTVGGVKAGTNGAGASGNPSWFGSIGTVYSEGGAGGAAPNGGLVAGGAGSSASTIGTIKNAGGSGAGGTSTSGGAGGGGAGSTGIGGNATGITAGTGTTTYGGNGGVGRNSENDGVAGNLYGGGGGGAYIPLKADHIGGNGAAGYVLISWVTVSAVSTETCVGGSTGTITATGVGGQTPYTFSIDGTNFQASGTFSGLAAGIYTITIKDNIGLTAFTSATVNEPATSSDDQNAAGNNTWIGHVYDGTNQAIAYNGNFTNYFGHYSQTETFDEGFGGNAVCFDVTSNSTTRSIYTETFSVRYRMNSTKKGLYLVDLGSDDGSRLTVDGTLLYNNWNDQGFSTRAGVLMNLNGASSLVYDFYENGWGNRVVFQNMTQVLANTLSTNLSQSICLGSSGAAITGDTYGTLPTGISLSGTGYQWTYSTTPAGARINITGATSDTYAPNASAAPFNVPGTYYIFRNAVLSSSNNMDPNPYVATNESNAATLTVNTAPNVSGLTTTAAAACSGSTSKITVSATSLPAGTYIVNYTLSGANTQAATNATMTAVGGNIGTFNTSALSSAGSTTVTINSISSGSCITTATLGNSAVITVTSLPAAIISYIDNPLCKTSPSANVSLTGTTGGSFSASPVGLTIDPVTGSVNANTSTAGNYTVTYTMAATGGCTAQTTTTSVTILPTNCANRVFYSLKSGSWDDPTTWTLDPSGSLPLNPGNLTPTTSPTSAFDEVVVLSGRTVTVPTNNKINNSLTVIGTLNFGTTTGNSFTTINGTGRIRLAADNFPAGDATNFITAGQGEGTVEYFGTTRYLTVARTFFNVEINMDAASIVSLLADYILNGSLTVTNGTYQINNNLSTTPVNITVKGDITVAASGKIATGTANARHKLNIYGNFTNSGDVRFTNRSAAIYASEATDGIVDANFLNTQANQSIFCRGITNFYRIEINKGSDFTYTLNLDATAPANFNLFGYANENHAAIAQLVNNNNALGLISGTIRIGNSIIIPTLSTANNYSISEDAQLWINGGTVQKNSGLTIAVYGKIKITTGLLEAKVVSGITLANNGSINVEGGIANINQLRTSDLGAGPNNGGYIQTGGAVNVLGGTTNTDYYVFSLPSTASVFNMSGGTLKVNTATGNGAILINSDPENVKITGGTVIAETASTDDFVITSRSPFWNLELKNSTAVSRQFTLGAASNIGPSDINVAVQPLKVLNDFRIWGVESGGPTYPQITFNPLLTDIYIGGSFFIEKGAQYVAVTGGTAPYDATANQPTNRNTTYFNKTAGTDAVEEFYVGETTNQLELGRLVVDRTAGYEVKVTSGATRVNESVAIDVNGDASVLSGILNQNLYTIRTWGAIVNNGRMGTWYPGITPSRAQIQIVENPLLTLTTSANAIFGNVQVNVTPPAKVSLSSDTYIERLEYVKGLIYLKNFNLKVDNLWNMETGIFENSASNSFLKLVNNGYSGSSMIFTDGKASDGGLSLKIIANSQAENQPNIVNNFGPTTYPVGFTSNGGTTLYFRPAQVIVKNFSDDGYVTIRPVSGSLQTTNQAGGEVLQHYWRVSHSGFTTVPTVAYRFYYRNQKGTANVDMIAAAANEALYVPGKVLDESPYTRLYEPLANNDILKTFSADNNSRAITINGSSTTGLFTPLSTGITLENANYTAGVANRFTGSVNIYYTRDYQQQAMWNNNLTWTRSDLLNPLYKPHDSRQPAAGAYPGVGDVAVIGWVPWDDAGRPTLLGQPHGVWISSYSQQVAEVVFTKMTDAGGNPVPRYYRSNFQFRPTLCIDQPTGQLVAKLVKGEGLFWNRESDPDYTQMDIGDFARQDSSYVIYENFSDKRIIYNTPALFPNIYISNDGWGANDKDFTFAKDINTTGNVELLGDVNLVLPNGLTGNITAGRNLVMFENQNSQGGARIDFGNTGTARKIVIKGDLLMKNSNSIIQVINPNATAPLVDHELHVEGNIIQGTAALASLGLKLWSGASNDRITLYLDGNTSMTYNLVSGTIPDLYRVVVNKGNNQTTTAQFNTDFVLNGPTSGVGVAKALELKNGTFIYNNPNSASILTLTSGNDFFNIPSTAGLNIQQGTARATGNSGISLDGKLTISGGTLDMATGAGENPIEYSASGNASISVSSGNLNVGGQIRRSLTSDAGILLYNQTGGSVVVGQNAATANNRGVFEILNAGSSFNMTAGDLYIARAQSNPTISAFYFNPETSVIGTAANIHIGHTSTPAAQTIGIYAGKPLPRLRVNNLSGKNPIAKLEVVPVTITSLLSIDANATFNANGLDLLLNGDMTSLGTFIPVGNTTYLSGSGNQTITGNGSPLNFYNLDKTQNNNVILKAANTPLLISNELFLRSGTFSTSNNTVTVKGDVLNDAIHVYGGAGDGIFLNGITTQTLTGNGTFGKLTINNVNGIEVPVANQFKITNSLKMQAGVFNIGKNLLDFGVGAIIEQASPFSSTNMITTNISFTDNGIRKAFPAGPQADFIFPLGSADKYTPVTLSITANGSNTGSITVKPANEIHPSIIEDSETGTQIVDKDNALQYYWTLKSSGITGFTGTATMRYIDTDVKVTSPYTVADYFTASLMADGLGNWLKFPKTDFDETNKNLIFKFSNTDDTGISADYTAGAGDASLDGAIPNKVSKYETNNNGTWVTGTIWTPNVSGGPRGAIAKINASHTVTVDADYIAGYMTEVFGTLKLNSTVGHRLGIVNGNGTIYSEIGDLPAAVYDNFFSSAGGKLEFGGLAKNYEFLGNIIEVNHLKISGDGERRFPNNNLILNGDLTISGNAGLLAINYYNRKLSVKGNINRTGGTYEAGTGANATIALAGTLPQSITGSFSNSNALNNLEINNVNDVTILNDVEIDRELKLSNGLVTTSVGSLFRINYGAFVTPATGSPLSFVNGVLTKEMITGNSFTFPVGNASFTKAHGPIALLNVSGPAGLNDWNAAYFYANPDAIGSTASFNSPVTTVSHSEYWKIQAPTGGQSNISITLDGSSDVGSTIPDLNNLRIVGWNTTTSKWDLVGSGANISGTNINGTITTSSPVNFGSYSYFTLASTTPLSVSSASFTSPSVVNLCNGSSTTMIVAFSGTAPWVLTYKTGATTIVTPALATSPYSITVTPSATTVYTLTGITANGLAGTINGTTAVTVNVSPIPTIVISSNDADNTICQGASIKFTATAGLTNYSFRINGTIVQNGSSNTYTTSTLAFGTQSIDVIGTNAGACSATSSAIAVLVNPLPVAAGAITGAASVCKASSAIYTVPLIANASTYVWTYNNGATGTSTTNSITLTFPNSGSTTITVKGNNTCGDGTLSTFAVAVNTASTPGAAGTITGTSQVCKGGSGYIFNVPVVTNATSYIWTYTGSGATINGTGNSVTIDFSAGATNGDLKVAGTNGCSTGTISANYGVTVNTPPTVTITPVSPSICSSSSILLTASPTGGSGTYSSHLWTGTGASSLNNGSIPGPSFSNGIGGSYDLTYIVTDNRGCVGLANTTVIVNQAPIADAGPDAIGICTGTSPITLAGATAGGSYSGNPTWSGTGGSWTQNPDPALATFTPSTPSGTTIATLTLTGANGCSNTSDTRTITWNSFPFNAGVITGTPTVCQGQSGVAYSVPAISYATSYTWAYSGTGATITGTTNSVTITFEANATAGNLTVFGVNTCGNGVVSANYPIAITPTVGTPTAITVSAGVQPTCQLTNGTTTTTYATTATNNTGFNWSLSNATAGTIGATTGLMTWANGFSGSVDIRVTASGCNGPSAQVIRTVTITPTVGTPVFTLGATSTRCQGAAPVTYGATATNSTSITYTLSAAGLSSIVAATGAVTWDATYSGSATITASAAGCNGPKTATHTVTITPTVGTPVFTLGATSTRCQGAGPVTYSATATNNTGLTYSLDAASVTGGNSIVAGTGAVTYVAGWSGTSVITVSAAGCNGPKIATHTVTITPTVGTPVFTLSATSNRCRGAGVVTYTVTATNNTGLTYTLDAASVTGGNTIVAGTGAVTFVAGWSGTSIIKVTATGCNGPSTATHTVTIIGDQIWTGTVSTDWNNLGNWSCSFIPDLTTSVQIPNVTNKPVLSSVPIGAAKDIVIAVGASLTVTGNTLQIAGTITNNGTFTATTGTIEMKGSAAQTIGTSVFATNTIANLTITNSAGVTLSGALNVTGIVLAQTGDLNSGGNLTLVSSATQTALIDGSGNGQVTGNVTMQRYLPSAFGYKYFSSPFSNATVAQFGSYLSISATIPNFYSYDENHQNAGAAISGWTNYITSTNPLNKLEGYAANLGAIATPKTVVLNGTVNNGNQTRTLYNHNGTYTKGFNLVGNPYPSPIDWKAASGWAKTNIDDAIYFFDASGAADEYSGIYSYWVNGVPTSDHSSIIPSMQGFFVRVSDGSYPVTGSLGMNNSVRTNDLDPVFKAAILDDRTILRFTANSDGKSSLNDAVVIYFDPLSTLNFDKEMDALKLMNTDLSVPNLYSITPDARQLSINAMPLPVDTLTKIPLGFKQLKDGWINFKAINISQLPSDMNIYLIDAQEGVTQNLKQNPNYRLYLKTGEFNQRFTLVFSLASLVKPVVILEKMFTIVRSGDQLYVKINLPLNTRGDLFVTNMGGQTLLRKDVYEMETVEIKQNVGSGVYVVSMISGKRTQSEKILIRKDYE